MRVLHIVLIVMLNEKEKNKENSLKERRVNLKQLIGLIRQTFHQISSLFNNHCLSNKDKNVPNRGPDLFPRIIL